MPSPTEPDGRLATSGWSNWTWFAEPPSWQAALSIAPADGPRLAMTRVFERVESADTAEEDWHTPWEEGSFDAVVAHDLPDTTTDGVTVWQRAHRLLRPNGLLMLTSVNPLWYAGLRDGWSALRRGLGVRSLTRALHTAGFDEVRAYYLTNSIHHPMGIIPRDPQTTAAYENADLKHSGRGWLRAHVARIGLHALLYPGRLHLAYR